MNDRLLIGEEWAERRKLDLSIACARFGPPNQLTVTTHPGHRALIADEPSARGSLPDQQAGWWPAMLLTQSLKN
jgi:hypothetical protein